MELFPSRYIHVGGDEAVKDQWKASPRVQQRMRELGVTDETAMQAWLTARMQRFLAAHGRRLIGWDEILEGELPADAAVMSWRGIEGAQVATAKGHDAVLSPWPTLYFDNRQGTGANEPPGRLRVVFAGGRVSLRSAAAGHGRGARRCTCLACRATSGPSTSARCRACSG
jgi:hexosaminidase